MTEASSGSTPAADAQKRGRSQNEEDIFEPDIAQIKSNLGLLMNRIKHTSSVRFFSSKRLDSNYKIAQLTVVLLSLWAITISYALATGFDKKYQINTDFLTAAGVILPVFIVVFSLLENGETSIRAYQLEANARQLRELYDQLYTAAAVKGLSQANLVEIYGEFSQRYSDCLERTPVNHDDVDHLHHVHKQSAIRLRKYRSDNNEHQQRERSEPSEYPRFLHLIIGICKNCCKIYFKRILYVAFWFAPLGLFFL